MDDRTRSANEQIRWIDEIVELVVGNHQIETSWIAHGGFKVTDIGHSTATAFMKGKINKADIAVMNLMKEVSQTHKKMAWGAWGGELDNDVTLKTLIYIDSQNLNGRVPTFSEISTNLFKDAHRKALLALQNLHGALMVEMIEGQQNAPPIKKGIHCDDYEAPIKTGIHCYDILGVSPSATQVEVETAYMKKALAALPRFGGSEESSREIKAAFDEVCKLKGWSK